MVSMEVVYPTARLTTILPQTVKSLLAQPWARYTLRDEIHRPLVVLLVARYYILDLETNWRWTYT
jgi:hypothetical protein